MKFFVSFTTLPEIPGKVGLELVSCAADADIQPVDQILAGLEPGPRILRTHRIKLMGQLNYCMYRYSISVVIKESRYVDPDPPAPRRKNRKIR